MSQLTQNDARRLLRDAISLDATHGVATNSEEIFNSYWTSHTVLLQALDTFARHADGKGKQGSWTVAVLSSVARAWQVARRKLPNLEVHRHLPKFERKLRKVWLPAIDDQLLRTPATLGKRTKIFLAALEAASGFNPLWHHVQTISVKLLLASLRTRQVLSICALARPRSLIAQILIPILNETGRQTVKAEDVTAAVNTAALACDAAAAEEFITDLMRFVEFHSRDPLGKRLCDAVVAGLVKSMRKSGTWVELDHVVQIRQSFWDRQLALTKVVGLTTPPDKTITINDLPFAESIWVRLLQEAGYNQNIEVRIQPVPWSNVASALLNGQIDIAVYNDALRDQYRLLAKPGKGEKVLYRLKQPLLAYDGYYVLALKAWLKENADGSLVRRVLAEHSLLTSEELRDLASAASVAGAY